MPKPKQYIHPDTVYLLDIVRPRDQKGGPHTVQLDQDAVRYLRTISSERNMTVDEFLYRIAVAVRLLVGEWSEKGRKLKDNQKRVEALSLAAKLHYLLEKVAPDESAVAEELMARLGDRWEEEMEPALEFAEDWLPEDPGEDEDVDA